MKIIETVNKIDKNVMFKKVSKNMLMFFSVFALVLLFSSNRCVYAFDKNILFTGTKKLIQSLTTALTGISGAITGLLLLWNFFVMQMSDDETDGTRIKKRMKKIAICGITVFCISGLTTIVLGFYGGK